MYTNVWNTAATAPFWYTRRITSMSQKLISTIILSTLITGCAFGQNNIQAISGPVLDYAKYLPADDIVDLAEKNYTVRIPIIMYHQIRPHDEEMNADQRRFVITPENFEKQMRWLKENGYETIGMSDFNDVMRGHDTVLPEKPIVITFDDGYINAYTVAFPLLKELGYQATFFIVINEVQKAPSSYLYSGHMTWDQIAQLVHGDMELGSHTMSHPYLATLSESEIINEVQGSKNALKDLLGYDAKFFSYPYGSANDQVRRIVAEAGYELGVGVLANVDHTVGHNFLNINRIEVNNDFDHFRRYVLWVNELPPDS